ncbi:hypothetical protein RYX36_014415 [Vicia faba]
MSHWRNILGLNVTVTSFLQKYPHVFDLFLHPFGRNMCCRITRKMKELILLEDVAKRCELEIVMRVKKLLNGTLRVHALRLVGLEIVALVDWDDELGKACVEE